MHDLDRTQNLFETDQQETEFNFEEEGEYMGEYMGEGEGEFGYEAESGFNEVEEMELAAELLEISDEEELEQFLGNLIKRAGRAVGKFARSGVGRQLGGLLKGAAKSALPIVGSALGNLVVPGLGGAVGGKLASAAGGMFGLELEGLSPQDQEFEVARRFVRFAGAAARNAARAPSNAPPRQVARNAVVKAAQKHAPGLLRGGAGAQQQHSCNCPQARGGGRGQMARRGGYGGGATRQQYGRSQNADSQSNGGGQTEGSSGQWVRQNGQIILTGI